jgi:hypothetical protein
MSDHVDSVPTPQESPSETPSFAQKNSKATDLTRKHFHEADF